MSNIYNFQSQNIPYESISLGIPTGIQGGTYLSKLKIDNSDLKIQTDTCSTKNGIIKTDKKIYCDLIFNEDDTDLLNIISEFEATIKDIIYEKRNIWFHTEMDQDTIDYHWQPILRKYSRN